MYFGSRGLRCREFSPLSLHRRAGGRGSSKHANGAVAGVRTHPKKSSNSPHASHPPTPHLPTATTIAKPTVAQYRRSSCNTAATVHWFPACFHETTLQPCANNNQCPMRVRGCNPARLQCARACVRACSSASAHVCAHWRALVKGLPRGGISCYFGVAGARACPRITPTTWLAS